jgi:hypothetical protein
VISAAPSAVVVSEHEKPNSLQKLKWYFKLGARHHVQSGSKTYFWFDWWLGNATFKDRFPNLFATCSLPYITVHAAWNHSEWGILFRRPFGLPESVEWDNLTRELDGVVLSPVVDVISWSLEPLGRFSMSSIYLLLSRGAAVSHFKEVWYARVPPRVRFPVAADQGKVVV